MLEATVDKQDLSDLVAAINRAEKELGKSTKDAVQWAGYYFLRSLAARTKVAKKVKRKIVQRPDGKWKTDLRIAQFGTMRYKKGKQVFSPIAWPNPTRAKFRDPNTGEVMWLNKKTNKAIPIEKLDGKKASTIYPGIGKSPKLIIANTGLAKRAYGYLKARLKTGGSTNNKGQVIGSVMWRDKEINPTLIIANDLRYATDALMGGPSTIMTIQAAAARGMIKKIDWKIAKKVIKK